MTTVHSKKKLLGNNSAFAHVFRITSRLSKLSEAEVTRASRLSFFERISKYFGVSTPSHGVREGTYE